MRSDHKLGKAMQPGRVYRRQDLTTFSTAVDRDLQNLVREGIVRKVHSGLYVRPQHNAFGVTPPRDEALVRAFLNSDDFLLASYNHYNTLGLGLTQVYNETRVYNHKRSGAFRLDGRTFRFFRVPAFPRKLSREYLLVDLLNNLDRIPDDVARVKRHLRPLLDRLDKNALRRNLELYGRPVARRALREAGW